RNAAWIARSSFRIRTRSRKAGGLHFSKLLKGYLSLQAWAAGTPEEAHRRICRQILCFENSAHSKSAQDNDAGVQPYARNDRGLLPKHNHDFFSSLERNQPASF